MGILITGNIMPDNEATKNTSSPSTLPHLKDFEVAIASVLMLFTY
ncbi:MAG: hypothetical protein QNJ54_32015 [Prochloraceae cyanobacterium]|nr:hypothetical protein [Prochloraceae cyanobacterium]